MLDGCIEENEAEQLESLLLHSEAARRCYVEVVQMHVDLLGEFGGLSGKNEVLKEILDAKLTEPTSGAAPQAGEIPKTETSGA